MITRKKLVLTSAQLADLFEATRWQLEPIAHTAPAAFCITSNGWEVGVLHFADLRVMLSLDELAWDRARGILG